MLGVIEIIKSPTHLSFSGITLTDHILASFSAKLPRKGVTDNGLLGVTDNVLSDHQLIYCTRKISRIKTKGIHRNIKFYSLQNYMVDAY